MECEVCTETYDCGNRTPLVLQCGHSFCKACITNCVQQALILRCPRCREADYRGVARLRSNFALLEATKLDVAALASLRGLHIDTGFLLDERELQLKGISLGSGAAGKVLEGLVCEGLYKERPVAVKVTGIADAPPAILQSLQNELAVILSISGECHRTCQYKGATIKDNQFCLVMRKYDKSLAKVIAEYGAAGGLPLLRVIRYSNQVLAALAELHHEGVIVVDLKPQNLLLDCRADELVVTNFGLSRTIKDTPRLRVRSTMPGTPNYMSPELIAAAEDGVTRITAPTDMWSWACIVIHMATGKMPFAGLDMTQIAAQVRVQHKIPEIPNNLPVSMKDLLRSCLSHVPARRPSALQALKDMESGVMAAAAALRPARHVQQQSAVHTSSSLPVGRALKQLLLASKAQLGTAGVHGDFDTWKSGSELIVWDGLIWGLERDAQVLRGLRLQLDGCRGYLPESWGKLVSLRSLSLEGFVGPEDFPCQLPPEWSALTALTSLSISWCSGLSTTLPSCWSALIALKQLDLSNNRLTGGLPSEWSSLTNLSRLHLGNKSDWNKRRMGGNQLHGPLPPEWAALTKLEELDLMSNSITGTLPPEWAALTNVSHLCLSSNELTGPLPAAWSSLVGLTFLSLVGNQLAGPLPPEWAALTRLKGLAGYGNELTGHLPAEWSSLASLDMLTLNNNKLDGPLPAAWAGLTSLTVLELSSNKITGPLPREWATLTNLKELHLDNNALCGTLPATWSGLNNLRVLRLSDNKLNGGLLPQWHVLRKLQESSLDGNMSRGSVLQVWRNGMTNLDFEELRSQLSPN